MRLHLVILLNVSSAILAQEKVSYDEQVFPIFQQTCLNCHNPDKAKGGLDLSSFPSTIKGSSGGKIVEPGDLGSSLIAAVEHTSEPKMPPEGEKLSTAQILVLRQWIEGGLLENKSSAARKPTKPKFETSLRSDPAAKPEGPPPMPEHLLLEPPRVTDRPAAIRALAASPWAPLLAITSYRQVLLHHTETLELVGILPFPEGDPVSTAFTPDGRYLIVGGGVPGKSGMTVTFDITTGERLLTVGKEFDSVLAADIRPGFDVVATGGPSRLLKLWNTESGDLIKSVKKHTDWITALDLSADGVLLASGDRNGGVWVWESLTCNEFHTLRGHQAAITSTAFRADSNILATASQDGTVRFWEMNGGSEVGKNDAHPGGVTAFAFAPDGSSVTAGRDMKAKLWKPDFSHARDLAENLPALPTAAALDFEGKRAFIADAQGTVHAFQTGDGKPLGDFKTNPPTIAVRLKHLTEEIQNLTQSTVVDDEQKKALTALQASFHHWSAAALNTQALAASQQANEQALAVEESQLSFTRHAQTLETQATALNAKRGEAGKLRARLEKPSLSPELTAEFQATLTAVEIRLSHQAAALRRAEDEALTSRARIEEAAPLAHQKHTESVALKISYLQLIGSAK